MDAQIRFDSLFRPPAPIPHSKALGALALMRTLWRNPLEAWTEAHFVEPISRTRIATQEVLLVNEPQALRRVLLDNASNYERAPLQRRIMPPALRDGMLMSDGEQWRRQRKLLAPMFTRRAVQEYFAVTMRAVDALVQRWSRKIGKTFDVSADVTLLTLDVLERTIFSEGFGRSAQEVRRAMLTYFDALGTIEPFDLLGCPDFIPRLARFRARRETRVFNNVIDRMIGQRREMLARADAGAEVPADMLTLLLRARDAETGVGLSEDEVRANVLTFIVAGHETTADAIQWSLYLLSRSPEWSARVAAEAERASQLPAEERLDELVVTRAVVDESMRLYPPIAAITRAAVQADELSGVEVRPGTMIVIAPYVLHRHRKLWSAPEIFDPSRFLGSRKAQIERFAYLPFGSGPRMCIGHAFALQEAVLAVSTLMREFVLRPKPGERVWPVLKITLRPENGLPMYLARRERAGLRWAAEPEFARA
jgi:cytochrome P450